MHDRQTPTTSVYCYPRTTYRYRVVLVRIHTRQYRTPISLPSPEEATILPLPRPHITARVRHRPVAVVLALPVRSLIPIPIVIADHALPNSVGLARGLISVLQ